MLVIRAGISKKLVRIANREDPDQTASSETVWSGSAAALFVKAFFGRQNFLTFTVIQYELHYIMVLLSTKSQLNLLCT